MTALSYATTCTSAELNRSFQIAATGSTFQFQQAYLQAALAHRERVQQAEGLRIATRYDRLARNYLASVCLAAALVWWI